MKNILLFLLLIISGVCFSQEVALKTNVPYWATTTLNLGMEVGISPKMSFDLTGSYNPFVFHGDRKIKHWLIQPEWRFWTCQRFSGHFFGIHAHGGQYNVALQKYRYNGWLVGGGLSYGYQWIIGRRWNLEVELGVGYAYMKDDKYLRNKCRKYLKSDHRNYVGLTKLSISFMYFLK